VRRWGAALAAAVMLLTGVVVSEKALQRVEREDPLGRRLLFLPSATMLRLASLGNPGLVADAVYLWSIQYYGQFKPHDRFLYLEPVYDLITDLDPLYHDAYRVGALIMQLPTTDAEAHKRSVIRLYDKALRKMPSNAEIAEIAGWDMYARYRDRSEAIRYFSAALAVPGAPHRLKRFVARWSEDEEGWSVDDALAYWNEVLADAETEYDRRASERQIYRLVAARDEEILNPILASWKLWHGRCPEEWQEVVDSGFLPSTPTDHFGKPYRILEDSCTVMGEDSVRFD